MEKSTILKCQTDSPTQTKKIGELLAKEILRSRFQNGALIFGLEGDLGGGKTTFLQGFAKGLGIKEKITSPTFVIIKRFQISSFMFHDFYHIDCYRIKNPKEILKLNFKKIISNHRNIIAIEWADRIKKILPKNTVWISFKFVKKNRRIILVNWKRK